MHNDALIEELHVNFCRRLIYSHPAHKIKSAITPVVEYVET